MQRRGRPCKDPMCPLPLPSATMSSSGWGRPPRPSKHCLVSSRPRRRTARHRQERDARRTGGDGLGGGPKSASEGIADTERPRRLPSELPTHEAERPTHGALTEAHASCPMAATFFVAAPLTCGAQPLGALQVPQNAAVDWWDFAPCYRNVVIISTCQTASFVPAPDDERTQDELS